MVESKLRVERTYQIAENNPFYGKAERTEVYEDIVKKDKHDINGTSKYGVILEWEDDNAHLKALITPTYFEEAVYDNTYAVSFYLGDTAYQIEVAYRDGGVSIEARVSEWHSIEDFEDGDAPSLIFKGKEVRIEPYSC